MSRFLWPTRVMLAFAVSCTLAFGCTYETIPYEPTPLLTVDKAIAVVQRHIEESAAGSGPNTVAVSDTKIEFTHQVNDYGLLGSDRIKTTDIYFFDSIGKMKFYPRRDGLFLVQVYSEDGEKGFELLVPTRERGELFLDAMRTLIDNARERGPTTRF